MLLSKKSILFGSFYVVSCCKGPKGGITEVLRIAQVPECFGETAANELQLMTRFNAQSDATRS